MVHILQTSLIDIRFQISELKHVHCLLITKNNWNYRTQIYGYGVQKSCAVFYVLPIK